MLTNADLTAPYSQEAEMGVLGAVAVNPSCYPSIAAFLKADDFFLLRHNYIWQAYTRLTERGEVIDYLTVCEELKVMGKLDAVGGPAYITNLVIHTPSSMHGEVYGRIVEDKSKRRQLLTASDKIKVLALDEQKPMRVILSDAEALLHAAAPMVDEGFYPVGSVAQAFAAEFARIEADGKPIALPTGFADLDALLGGLTREYLYVLGGRPGMGKTSLLIGMAINAARAGARVGFVTMEMPSIDIVKRMIAVEAGLSTGKVMNPIAYPLGAGERERMQEAIRRVSQLSIAMDDTPGSLMTPAFLRSKARRLQHEHGLDVLFVDHIQEMNGGAQFRRAQDRRLEISFIVRALKELSRDLKIPVMAASQLTREVEKRNDKHPLMSDLRESGDIEGEADAVLFLYRDGYYNEATEFPNQAQINVAKQRNGATGTVTLYFEKSSTRFSNGVAQHVSFKDTPPIINPTRWKEIDRNLGALSGGSARRYSHDD